MNRKFITGLAAVATIFAVTSLGAQDPAYILSAGSAAGSQGSSVNAAVTIDNNGMNMGGWSYGVCNDPAIATPTGVNNEGSDTVNGGGPAGFLNSAFGPDGWTQGVVVDLFGVNSLPSGAAGFVAASADYDLIGAPGTITALDFCDTLGTPPVAVVVVINGASIVPTTNSGQLEVLTDPCDVPTTFEYGAPTLGPGPGFNYPSSGDAGSVAFSATFTIAETSAYPAGEACPGAETQGFSMGVSHDPALLEANSVSSTGAVAALNGGGGPAFETPGIFPNGWTVGIVYSLAPPVETIVLAGAEPAVSVGYNGVAGALAGVTGPTTTPLTWDDGLGSPPVSNVVVVGGGSIAAGFANGDVTLNGTTTLDFIRGDSNGDLIVNIADPIWLLAESFIPGSPSNDCVFADDANNDGNVDAADAVYQVTYIFLGGPAPAAPFPDCGQVMGQQPEDCAQSPCP